MALDTYTHLQTAIAGWLNRADLTTQIVDFITLAEVQMTRRIMKARNEGQMLPRDMVYQNNAFAITANTEFANLPADFLGMLSFYIDPQTIAGNTYGAQQLDYVGPENLEYLKQKRGPSPTTKIPAVYTIVGSQIQFLPIPDLTYTGTMWYWQAIPSLASNATNWILTKHPDAYLYGALMQAAPYLMDDARTEIWADLFQNALNDMITSDPLPNDRMWLRADSGLIFRTNRASSYSITSDAYPYGP